MAKAETYCLKMWFKLLFYGLRLKFKANTVTGSMKVKDLCGRMLLPQVKQHSLSL